MPTSCLRNVFLSVLVILSPFVHAADKPEMQLVTDLDAWEVSEGLLWHSGYFWVTKRLNGDPKFLYAVELYDANGKNLLGRVGLEHGATSMMPYGKNTVAVQGRFPWPLRTDMSLIKWNNTALQKSTVTLTDTVVDRATTANDGSVYASHPGNREILQVRNRRTRALPLTISNPGELRVFGNELWAVERQGMGMADDNLVHHNLQTGKSERLFTASDRHGLMNLLVLQKYGAMAISESFNDQIHLFDLKTRKLMQTIGVAGNPRDMAQYRNCLAVLSSDSKTITFFSLHDRNLGLAYVDTWDLSAGGEKLKLPRILAVNDQSGIFLVKSVYPCPDCRHTQSSVYRVFAKANQNHVGEQCK